MADEIIKSEKLLTKKEQDWLFDQDLQWKEHWKQMPEYIHENQESFKDLIVHFESWEDVQSFSKLVGQKLTIDTKSIWHPQVTISSYTNKRWVDEKETK